MAISNYYNLSMNFWIKIKLAKRENKGGFETEISDYDDSVISSEGEKYLNDFMEA